MTAEVEFTGHALIRFRDRVRPGLRVVDAQAELVRAADQGFVEWSTEPPWWFNENEEEFRETSGYLMYGADVCFVLCPPANGGEHLAAVTCVTHGDVSDAARAKRAENRKRRANHRSLKRDYGRSGQSTKGRKTNARYE